jgi:cytochrome c
MNKYFAAVLVTLIVIKLSSIVSDSIMHVEPLQKPGYIVAGSSLESSALEIAIVEKIEPITTLIATANIENGKKLAQRCSQCHGFDKGDPHKSGPNLWGLIGSKPGSKEGYTYSDAMKSKKDNWDIDHLDAYLFNPRLAIPGTKMVFVGMRNTQERADLIAFLSSLK